MTTSSSASSESVISLSAVQKSENTSSNMEVSAVTSSGSGDKGRPQEDDALSSLLLMLKGVNDEDDVVADQLEVTTLTIEVGLIL